MEILGVEVPFLDGQPIQEQGIPVSGSDIECRAIDAVERKLQQPFQRTHPKSVQSHIRARSCETVVEKCDALLRIHSSALHHATQRDVIVAISDELFQQSSMSDIDPIAEMVDRDRAKARNPFEQCLIRLRLCYIDGIEIRECRESVRSQLDVSGVLVDVDDFAACPGCRPATVEEELLTIGRVPVVGQVREADETVRFRLQECSSVLVSLSCSEVQNHLRLARAIEVK